MRKIMLVQPWRYQDEGKLQVDLAHEWRNGPYSLITLGTQLCKHGYQVKVVDLMRDLVVLKGNVKRCLEKFARTIIDFKPDIIGFSFFSLHYIEVKNALRWARSVCQSANINSIFIAGGIHASIEPNLTIRDLEFDYAFVGEADQAILELATNEDIENISGIVGQSSSHISRGQVIKNLDSLPFPDWSLCDYRFYSYPSFGKIKSKAMKTLDMMMGRGCPYKCSFCAYNALSPIRFFSPEYLVSQFEYMLKQYGIDSIYFIDSSVGNNLKQLRSFCELMIKLKFNKKAEWYGNMRADQVDEDLLKLMWEAGCRFLFYGFESGSQRVLEAMNKKCSVEKNRRAAEIHNKLNFPYHASIILGFPGETEEDIQLTLKFIRDIKPPLGGINWYVPLPGSSDYEKLKADGMIDVDDPYEWRRVGESNKKISKVYANVSKDRFIELFYEAKAIMPKKPKRW
jgi:radical SAM superfamily enzyme YgiQ (UPF0313 family)